MDTGEISATGALLADPARAAMLVALCGDETALPASELAGRAGIGAATASAHLAKLMDAGWVAMEQYGRHHYFRLASTNVIALLRQMAAAAPEGSSRLARYQREPGTEHTPLRSARTCYDHLAGRLGVAVTELLRREDALRADGQDFTLTPTGETLLRDWWGVDAASIRRKKRAFARRCLDWSERRDHLAGALGASVCDTWLERGWVRRRDDSRALDVTPEGVAELQARGMPW